jgi:hypothetical protein
MNIYVCYILLIILIIVAILLLLSIANDNRLDLNNTITGGEINIEEPVEIIKSSIDKSKKIRVVDGLNYIYHNFLTTNKVPVKDIEHENLISNYPNCAYIWKAIVKLRHDHKNDYIVFVIKNQDGYKLSIYDDKLYKRWAKSYKIGIIVCYDPSALKGGHYIKGRDDKTVCEIYDKYKTLGVDVEIISNDSYSDKSHFTSIPSFKKIIYGTVPYLDID